MDDFNPSFSFDLGAVAEKPQAAWEFSGMWAHEGMRAHESTYGRMRAHMGNGSMRAHDGTEAEAHPNHCP